MTPNARRRNTIRRLLGQVEEKLKNEPGKVSLADYVRLLQLEREMDADEPPKEILVQWVESEN